MKREEEEEREITDVFNNGRDEETLIEERVAVPL